MYITICKIYCSEDAKANSTNDEEIPPFDLPPDKQEDESIEPESKDQERSTTSEQPYALDESVES